MSKDLFELVKSLSPSEKRYFKINANNGASAKNYLRLFDVIDKMNIYDEKLVQKKFRNEPFLENLHVNKNYLYQAILRNLRSYYEKKSSELRLHNLMIDAIVLDYKGQYGQARKLLQRVKKLSIKYDNQAFLLNAIRLEIKLSFVKPKKLEKEINQLCQKLSQHLNLLEDELQLYIVKSKIFAAHRTHYLMPQIKLPEDINSEPLLRMPPDSANFNISFLFHRIWATYFHLSKELKPAYEHYSKIIDLWESFEHQKKDKPYLYKIQLSNYLCICHELCQYRDFEKALAKIKFLPSQSFDEEAETFQNVAYFELLYYMNKMQFSKAKEMVPYIDKGLKRYARKVNKARQLAFWYNITILFFALEDHEKALDWLTHILNEPNTEHRRDIQYFARFLELIFHFELKNLQVFDYLLRSLGRLVNKQGEAASNFEKLLIQYFKKLTKIVDKEESKRLFQNYQQDLKRLPLAEKKLLCFEEVSIWVATKISGYSFLKVMKVKHR